MTLASAANAVEVTWYGSQMCSSNGNNVQTALFRGNNAVTTQLGNSFLTASNTSNYSPVMGVFLDTPYAGATTSAAYTVGAVSPGSTTVAFPSSPGSGGMYLKELMG